MALKSSPDSIQHSYRHHDTVNMVQLTVYQLHLSMQNCLVPLVQVFLGQCFRLCFTNSMSVLYQLHKAHSRLQHTSRPGGNGMAGTAMVQPVQPQPYWFLREKKWHRLDSNLRVHYGIVSPSSLSCLGRLNYDEVFLRVFRVFNHPNQRREE